MAQCARCNAETELYRCEVPICLACDGSFLGLGRQNDTAKAMQAADGRDGSRSDSESPKTIGHY
jgi:hypothetical protein